MVVILGLVLLWVAVGAWWFLQGRRQDPAPPRPWVIACATAAAVLVVAVAIVRRDVSAAAPVLILVPPIVTGIVRNKKASH